MFLFTKIYGFLAAATDYEPAFTLFILLIKKFNSFVTCSVVLLLKFFVFWYFVFTNIFALSLPHLLLMLSILKVSHLYTVPPLLYLMVCNALSLGCEVRACYFWTRNFLDALQSECIFSHES